MGPNRTGVVEGVFTDADEGGVHANSGIHNKAAWRIFTALDLDGSPLFSEHDLAQGTVAYRFVPDNYADRLEFNPERLQEVEERLELIHGLKRKYGDTIEQIVRNGDVPVAGVDEHGGVQPLHDKRQHGVQGAVEDFGQEPGLVA